MTKRIALLVSLVMIFSLSFVFATEESADTLLAAPAISGEISEDLTSDVSGDAVVSGDVLEAVSGDAVESVSGDVTEDIVIDGTEIPEDNKASNVETNNDETEELREPTGEPELTEKTESNNTVVGAVIAIVVVVAVVVIVAVLQKKK